MARLITVLESRRGSDGTTTVSGAFWFAISQSTAKVPKPGYTSVLANVTGDNAITTAEQTGLEDGSIREEPFNVSYPSSVTLTEVQTDLVKRQATRAAAIAAEPATRQFYGRTFDGTIWVA